MSRSYEQRQTMYLRISPSSVLHFILYLEPAHVHWMTDDRLERVLLALKERIPKKLMSETETGRKKGGGAKEKTHVDVYRGADYQMAFFFRKSGKKHVVLLKDKQLIHAARSPPPASLFNPNKRPHDDLDLTAEEEAFIMPPPPPPPGPAVGEDGLLVVKDEEVEIPLPEVPNSPPGPVRQFEEQQEEEEVKFEYDEDVKPQLKVEYRGYSIFNRSLVVILEPYPALAAKDVLRPTMLPIEVRQLSASVAPDYRPTPSTSATRAGSSSATPAPIRRRIAEPLFRTATTPLVEEEDEEDEEDEGMQELRESSEVLANEFDERAEDEEELPSLDQVLARRRGTRSRSLRERSESES